MVNTAYWVIIYITDPTYEGNQVHRFLKRVFFPDYFEKTSRPEAKRLPKGTVLLKKPYRKGLSNGTLPRDLFKTGTLIWKKNIIWQPFWRVAGVGFLLGHLGVSFIFVLYFEVPQAFKTWSFKSLNLLQSLRRSGKLCAKIAHQRKKRPAHAGRTHLTWC